jgi:hypothetical protein
MVLTQLHYIVIHTIQMLIMYLTLLMTWQCYNFDLLLQSIDKTNDIKGYRKESLMKLDANLFKYVNIKCSKQVANLFRFILEEAIIFMINC